MTYLSNIFKTGSFLSKMIFAAEVTPKILETESAKALFFVISADGQARADLLERTSGQTTCLKKTSSWKCPSDSVSNLTLRDLALIQ